MPFYPLQKYDFQTACIQLDSQLNINDTLFLKLGGNAQSHIFNPVQLNQFIINPDFELYLLDCRITYDVEWHYLFLESLFRDHKFDYAYIKRSQNDKLTVGNVVPPTPPSLIFDLQEYRPILNDRITYSLNGTYYTYALEYPKIYDLYKEDGYQLNKFNHRLKVDDTYLGRTLYLIAGQASDVFTSTGIYTIATTFVDKVSSTLIPSQASYVLFETEDQIREGDRIEIITTKTSYTHVFTPTNIAQLMGTWKIELSNFRVRFVPIYHGSLRIYNIELTLTDNTDIILSAAIKQPNAFQYFFCDKIGHEYSVLSSNPSFDTATEQLFHSRSELDHIKQRCICAIAGAFAKLKDPDVIGVGTTKAQKVRDHIMDYIIYPNTCLLSTKQYIWDNYGPFTSRRPVGAPELSYMSLPSGSYSVPAFHTYIRFVFKETVILGTGNIIIFEVQDVFLAATWPLKFSMGNAKDPIIYLVFNTNIKFGFGRIILQEVENSMAVINGSKNIKRTGLITLSLPTNMKLHSGIGKLSLVPIIV